MRGPLELPKAETPLGAKRALNRRLPGGGVPRRRGGGSIEGGVDLPYGVRVIRRYRGMYRSEGTYLVVGGTRPHPSVRGAVTNQPRAFAFDALEDALAEAFARVRFAEQEATAAEEYVGRTVRVWISPGYGLRKLEVDAPVIRTGGLYRDRPGEVIIEYAGREYARHYRDLEGRVVTEAEEVA